MLPAKCPRIRVSSSGPSWAASRPRSPTTARCSSDNASDSSQRTPTVIPDDIRRRCISRFIRAIRSRASMVRSWIWRASWVSRASSRTRRSESVSSSSWSRRAAAIRSANTPIGTGPLSSTTRTRMIPLSPVPLGPVLVAGRRQLGGQFVQRPGQAGGGLLDRGLGGPQLAGRRQDRLVQGGDLGREGAIRVVPLVVAGGPAQPGRAAQQAQDVVVGERFEALRRGPLLGPRRGQCGGRGVALGLGPRDRGRRALPRGGGGRPLVLGRGDAPLRLLDPGQHLPGLGAHRLAQHGETLGLFGRAGRGLLHLVVRRSLVVGGLFETGERPSGCVVRGVGLPPHAREPGGGLPEPGHSSAHGFDAVGAQPPVGDDPAQLAVAGADRGDGLVEHRPGGVRGGPGAAQRPGGLGLPAERLDDRSDAWQLGRGRLHRVEHRPGAGGQPVDVVEAGPRRRDQRVQLGEPGSAPPGAGGRADEPGGLLGEGADLHALPEPAGHRHRGLPGAGAVPAASSAIEARTARTRAAGHELRVVRLEHRRERRAVRALRLGQRHAGSRRPRRRRARRRCRRRPGAPRRRAGRRPPARPRCPPRRRRRPRRRTGPAATAARPRGRRGVPGGPGSAPGRRRVRRRPRVAAPPARRVVRPPPAVVAQPGQLVAHRLHRLGGQAAELGARIGGVGLPGAVDRAGERVEQAGHTQLGDGGGVPVGPRREPLPSRRPGCVDRGGRLLVGRRRGEDRGVGRVRGVGRQAPRVLRRAQLGDRAADRAQVVVAGRDARGDALVEPGRLRVVRAPRDPGVRGVVGQLAGQPAGLGPQRAPPARRPGRPPLPSPAPRRGPGGVPGPGRRPGRPPAPRPVSAGRRAARGPCRRRSP